MFGRSPAPPALQRVGRRGEARAAGPPHPGGAEEEQGIVQQTALRSSDDDEPTNTHPNTATATANALPAEQTMTMTTTTADDGDTADAFLAREGDAEAVNEEADTTAEVRRREEERQQAVLRHQTVARKIGEHAKLKDAKAAQRRLMRDLRSLQQTLASPAGESMGLSAHPIDGDLFHWRAIVAGPEGSVWEGGLFKLDLQFSETYPMEPPHVRFLTKDVFHPNVYVDGNICLDTLKSCWSPTLDVEALLLSITSLLSDPNPASAANGAAARMLLENKPLYDERVRKLVEQSLEQSFSGAEDDDGESGDDDDPGTP